MQRPRPPFDRFRSPFRPFNAFPPRNRFDMPPHMHSFPGDPRMMPPPFRHPHFPPNTYPPRRPFMMDGPRPPPGFNMRPPREPRFFPPRFRPPSAMHRSPLLPQPQTPQTNPSNSPSSTNFPQDNHHNIYHQQPSHIHNFSNGKFDSASQDRNYENKYQENREYQNKRKYPSEDFKV